MLRESVRRLFSVSGPQEVRGTSVRRGASALHRRRLLVTNRGEHSASDSSAKRPPTRHVFVPPQRNSRGNPSVARVLRESEMHRASPFPDASSFTRTEASASSQRQRYRRQQQDGSPNDLAGEVPEAPASSLSPLPKKYGFYDGVDALALESPRPSQALRQHMLRLALEEQAASVVEVTDGGEKDIDLGGMPASEYHGQEGWTTIPKDSALYHSVFAQQELESRRRVNSWGAARRQRVQRDGGSSPAAASRVREVLGEYAHRRRRDTDNEVLDDVRRREHHDEGTYTHLLEGELLEPTPASIGHSRSVYGLRKLFVKGLVGYQGIVSRAEEVAMAEELLQLLQDPSAAYVAEETRYCVNLYERELGLPGKDTLAFPISRAPTLQKVLYRFFFLGWIPSPPNVVQVNEMIGSFSGYPVHRKPRAVGSYVGVLNLISTAVMHMQHVDCPWYPRLHLNPRSLFVISEPCLSEYAMGYKQTHKPFHSFDYATRVSKDYRIEVVFATVETEHMKLLSEAVQLTEYADERRSRQQQQQQQQPQHSGCEESTNPPLSSYTTSIDGHLERLRQRMHDASEGSAAAVAVAEGGGAEHASAIVDGAALRRRLEEEGLVGRRPQTLSREANRDPSSPSVSAAASAAQRRLAALKARHAFARQLRAEGGTVSRGSLESGPRLIRGHAPGDNRGW